MQLGAGQIGGIDPEIVVTPGIFVDTVVTIAHPSTPEKG